jgi:hypothetical protein
MPASGGVMPPLDKSAFIANFVARATCRWGEKCYSEKCTFLHSVGEASKKAENAWRNKTDPNKVAAKNRLKKLSKDCGAIGACKKCVNGEKCGCTALPVAHELAREEMVFQIKILPCPHFVAYGKCAHKDWPNAEGWSCKNYCHPEDDIEAMHAKLAAQGWKNTRWESKTRDTLKKMGVDETPQIMARLEMFRPKTAEADADEIPLSEKEELEAQVFLDEMLVECEKVEAEAFARTPAWAPNGVPTEEIVVEWEFYNFQQEEEKYIQEFLSVCKFFADYELYALDRMAEEAAQAEAAQQAAKQASADRWACFKPQVAVKAPVAPAVKGEVAVVDDDYAWNGMAEEEKFGLM